MITPAAPASAEIGSGFTEAAINGSISVTEILAKLKGALPHLTDPTYLGSIYFGEIFASAMRSAIDAETREVENLLRALPPESSLFEECFVAYADAKIRRLTEQLAKNPVRLEWRASAEPLPKELSAAPAYFQDAWKMYRTVIEPCMTLLNPPEEEEAPRKLPALGVDLRRAIGKPEPGAWKQLVAHRWVGWCGTGSESLYSPRNCALLLSFLADGKLREAAGMALAQVPSCLPVADLDRGEPVAVQLLTALGLDWEQVLFGSLLPVTGYDMATGRPVVTHGFSVLDPWRLLAAHSSERTVRQCLELIRWKQLDLRSAGEFFATALDVQPAEANRWTSSSHPVRTVKLAPETRKEIISILGEYLAPTNHPADLMQALQIVPSDCIEDVQAPLIALVSHRVHAVAVKAFGLLDLANLTTGKELIAPALPALSFRLLVNGKPLREAEVKVVAIAIAKAAGAPKAGETPVNDATKGDVDQTFDRPVAPAQDLTTGGNGELEYSLAESLEPERLAALQFRSGPKPYSSIEADGRPLSIPGLEVEPAPRQPSNDWPGPWILQEVEALAGDGDVHSVDFHTVDLEVKFSALKELPAETSVRVTLKRVLKPPSLGESGAVTVTTSVGGRGFFRRLQPGKYQLTADPPGAAHYDSGEIVVGETAVVHEARLEPGRNVRGTVVYPDGVKDSLAIRAKLLHEGIEIPFRDPEKWTGVPFGRYTVRVASTRDWEEEAKKTGHQTFKIPKEDRINGRDVNFVIDAATPATLDLGEIVISREGP